MAQVLIERRGRSLLGLVRLDVEGVVHAPTTGEVAITLDGHSLVLTDAEARRLNQALTSVLAMPTAPEDEAF